MYIVTFENEKEIFHGPFHQICFDSFPDLDHFTFLCYDSSDCSPSRITVGPFRIVMEV